MRLHLVAGDESRTAKLINHLSHENLESKWRQNRGGMDAVKGLGNLEKVVRILKSEDSTEPPNR